MNRWIRNLLTCLILISALALLFSFFSPADDGRVLNGEKLLTIGIIVVVVVVLWALELFIGAHFYTMYRRNAALVNFIAVCVVFLTALAFLIRRCSA